MPRRPSSSVASQRMAVALSEPARATGGEWSTVGGGSTGSPLAIDAARVALPVTAHSIRPCRPGPIAIQHTHERRVPTA